MARRMRVGEGPGELTALMGPLIGLDEIGQHIVANGRRRHELAEKCRVDGVAVGRQRRPCLNRRHMVAATCQHRRNSRGRHGASHLPPCPRAFDPYLHSLTFRMELSILGCCKDTRPPLRWHDLPRSTVKGTAWGTYPVAVQCFLRYVFFSPRPCLDHDAKWTPVEFDESKNFSFQLCLLSIEREQAAECVPSSEFEGRVGALGG